MPPSCNQRQRPAYGRGRRLDGRATLRLALTEEAVGFLACAPVLRMAWKRIMQWPLEDYAPFIFHFYLSNMAYDTHNGLKLACDLLQKSGLILNDRFILPQVAMPVHAPADPRLVIDFPVAAGNGPPQEDVTR